MSGGASPSLAALAISIALAACTSEPAPPPPATTEGQETASIALELSVRASDAFVLVQARPWSGATPLALAAGDRLEVSLDPDGAPHPLVAVGAGYAVELAGHPTSLVLSLRRDGARSAPATHVTLPPSFDLQGPSGPISRQAAFTLAWAPIDAGHPVSLTVDGLCLASVARFPLSDDPGTFTVQPGDLFVFDSQRGATCTLAATLVRASGGAVVFDPALDPRGRATFTQERTAQIVSTP